MTLIQKPFSLCAWLLLGGAVACNSASEEEGTDTTDNSANRELDGGSEPTLDSGVPEPEKPEPAAPSIDCSQFDSIIIDPTALIDDMEDGDGLIPLIGERQGSWWISTDGTEEGTVEPMAEAAPTPERILGERCGSQQAIRVTGQGFTDWGMVLAIGLRFTDDQEPIDASQFSGVMFWARVGELHSGPVRFQMQDGSTIPQGGVCDPDPGTEDTCFDAFGTQVLPLDTTWRLYRLSFDSLSQQGFGYSPEAFDPANLYTLEWVIGPNSVFDLWIDDVWFYE